MRKSDLAIAAPCTANWRTMTPADGGRFCGDCKKVVRDLSSMRERDARTLLHSARNGELCVRYLYDRHGRIFFGGDRAPAQLLPASLLQRAKRVALAAAAVAVPLSLQGCSPSSMSGSPSSFDRDQDEELYENMGGAPAMDPPVEATDGGGDAAPDGGFDAAPDGGFDAAPDGGFDAGPFEPPT